jgi:hypothetical protein
MNITILHIPETLTRQFNRAGKSQFSISNDQKKSPLPPLEKGESLEF